MISTVLSAAGIVKRHLETFEFECALDCTSNMMAYVGILVLLNLGCAYDRSAIFPPVILILILKSELRYRYGI